MQAFDTLHTIFVKNPETEENIFLSASSKGVSVFRAQKSNSFIQRHPMIKTGSFIELTTRNFEIMYVSSLC